MRTTGLIKYLYKEAICNFPSEEGKFFFTFDDGPSPDVTPSILEILDKYNAKATFFVLGENVEKFPDIFNEIQNRGHGIGNHSFSHPDGLMTKTESYLNDIEKANQIIKTMLFRPPYGRMKHQQFNHLKRDYKIILWDVMSYDFNSSFSSSDCIRKVTRNAKAGSIIVFHDSLKAKKNVLESLPFLLDFYSKKDFVFSSIPI